MPTAPKYSSALTGLYATPYLMRKQFARLISGQNEDGSAYLPPLLDATGGNILKVARVEAHGLSYTVGGGARTPATGGYMGRFSAMLGATLTNRAVSGAVASQPQASTTGDGGYAKALQDLPRTSYLSAPYLPASQIAVVGYGINDLGKLGPTNLTPFKEALRTILRRYRAASVFENDHASVTVTNGGSTTAAIDKNSGAGFRALTAASSVSIAVPADFPGTAISLGFIAAASTDSSPGTATVKVDGVTVATKDLQATTLTQSGKLNGVTIVIPSVPAGAHTITLTLANVQTAVYFDYWSIEAQIPPLILIPLAFRPYSYSTWTGGSWPYTPTDADIPVLNAAIQSVAAEFTDGMVLCVDTDTAIAKRADIFTVAADATQGHPNDIGHALIAQALYAAVRGWMASQPVATREYMLALSAA